MQLFSLSKCRYDNIVDYRLYVYTYINLLVIVSGVVRGKPKQNQNTELFCR